MRQGCKLSMPTLRDVHKSEVVLEKIDIGSQSQTIEGHTRGKLCHCSNQKGKGDHTAFRRIILQPVRYFGELVSISPHDFIYGTGSIR